MYDKILNQIPGRFVKTDGHLGQKIIKNYLNMIGGSSQTHEPDEYELNWKPFTTLEERETHTKPKFKLGDKVSALGYSDKDTGERIVYHGTIINILPKGTLIYDNDLEEEFKPEVWELDYGCECHIDSENSGSVWFEPDDERKYFVLFDHPKDHIDLIFDNI